MIYTVTIFDSNNTAVQISGHTAQPYLTGTLALKKIDATFFFFDLLDCLSRLP